jgi:PPP family 3-phenylpropionic acid transporter
VPEKVAAHLPLDHTPLRQVLKTPVVVSLLLACFLVQASHGPYYTFYSIYLSGHGYSESLIGQLWAFGVAAEIVVFLRMHRWLPRFGGRALMLVATSLATMRWLLLAAFVDHLWVMILAQTLHAASFGMYHAVSIHFIHRLFQGRHQGRGQALYSSLTFGAGGAVGSLLAGYLWVGVGAQWMYVAAALAGLAATWSAWRGIHDVD